MRFENIPNSTIIYLKKINLTAKVRYQQRIIVQKKCCLEKNDEKVLIFQILINYQYL